MVLTFSVSHTYAQKTFGEQENQTDMASSGGSDAGIGMSPESGGRQRTLSRDSAMSFDDVELSIQGITLLMNDQWAQAAELFNQYKEYSPTMSFGSSFVMVMQGIMSFEDEKLHAAMESLKETEKKCEIPTGVASGIKKRRMKKKHQTLEDRITRQTITGDCLLYQSILTFINQEISSYIKGGWLLRKAWKLYQKTHKEISAIYDAAKLREPPSKSSPSVLNGDVSKDGLPNGGESHGIPTNRDSPAVIPVEETHTIGNSPVRDPRTRSSSGSGSFHSVGSRASGTSSSGSEGTELPLDVAARLLGSVSFGYGTLQLVISLVPPRILKIIEFLGFDGDRASGLANLEVASKCRDMKAPLAIFALVWFHTVMRPFMALDGTNVNAGIADAEVVIERCRQEYPDSALYLFFKARVCRLKAEVDEAYSLYSQARDKCSNQREIQLISVYELGWLHMMRLEYQDAHRCFLQLKEDSRWSKCYYAYLSGICLGSCGDIDGAYQMLKEVPGLMKRKNNQLEQFVSKRAEKFKKMKPTREHLLLLVLEVLYLWNAIPNCKKSDLELHLEECNMQTDKKLFHLRSLVEGAIYRELDGEDMAPQCFEEAIARQQGMKEDKHVAAFSCYELGTIYAQKPETLQKAKKYFLQSKDQYKEFDMDNRLHVRTNAALKRLKAEGVS